MNESYHQDVAEAVDLIEKATSDSLAGPEWHINLMISDMANEKSVICDDIVHTLQRQLGSGSPHVALLTLFVAETLVKNGTSHVHQSFASRTFLNEVAALTDGSMGIDVQNKALVMIRQWADAFASSSLTVYQDTYRTLKIRGAIFPDIENDVPVFTPPPSSSSSISNVSTHVSTPRTHTQQVAKLNADLVVVTKKIELYRELRSSNTPFDAESMIDVLDFLRQCQPRMNTLIEGGIMGKLNERTLEQCLNVNDNLIKVLEDAHQASRNAVDMISLGSPIRTAMSDVLNGVSSLNV